VKPYTIDVRISPRAGLLDPEGKAIHHALHSLEFDEVEDVRVGKLLRMKLLADSPEAARSAAEEMCRKLLANPVTEDFDIVVNGRN
jgi:phosphoribosylformylglycinamidine synthase